MAEASSKSGILALAQKRLARTKTKVLQNLGKAERTTDDVFNDFVLKTEKQQEVAHHLQKELKHFAHCLRDLSQASKSLHVALADTYEAEWTSEPTYKEQLQAFELLWNDYLQNVQDSVLTPLQTYLVSFPVLKAKMAKRGRKMVDYDNSRHHLEVLQAAKKKDEAKIQKAQEELKEAKRIYEELNNDLHHELPEFYNSRVTFYASLLTSLFGANYTFHSEVGKINSNLGDITQQLGKDFAQFTYVPKRPLSKSLSTNSAENGLNGEMSGGSTPSTPVTSTSPGSSTVSPVKGPSEPIYKNEEVVVAQQTAYRPKRRAPLPPGHLVPMQKIEEGPVSASQDLRAPCSSSSQISGGTAGPAIGDSSHKYFRRWREKFRPGKHKKGDDLENVAEEAASQQDTGMKVLEFTSRKVTGVKSLDLSPSVPQTVVRERKSCSLPKQAVNRTQIESTQPAEEKKLKAMDDHGSVHKEDTQGPLPAQYPQLRRSISLESSEHQRKKQMGKSGCPEGILLAEDELDSEASTLSSVAHGDEPGRVKQTLEMIGQTLHKPASLSNHLGVVREHPVPTSVEDRRKVEEIDKVVGRVSRLKSLLYDIDKVANIQVPSKDLKGTTHLVDEKYLQADPSPPKPQPKRIAPVAPTHNLDPKTSTASLPSQISSFAKTTSNDKLNVNIGNTSIGSLDHREVGSPERTGSILQQLDNSISAAGREESCEDDQIFSHPFVAIAEKYMHVGSSLDLEMYGEHKDQEVSDGSRTSRGSSAQVGDIRKQKSLMKWGMKDKLWLKSNDGDYSAEFMDKQPLLGDRSDDNEDDSAVVEGGHVRVGMPHANLGKNRSPTIEIESLDTTRLHNLLKIDRSHYYRTAFVDSSSSSENVHELPVTTETTGKPSPRAQSTQAAPSGALGGEDRDTTSSQQKRQFFSKDKLNFLNQHLMKKHAISTDDDNSSFSMKSGSERPSSPDRSQRRFDSSFGNENTQISQNANREKHSFHQMVIQGTPPLCARGQDVFKPEETVIGQTREEEMKPVVMSSEVTDTDTENDAENAADLVDEANVVSTGRAQSLTVMSDAQGKGNQTRSRSLGRILMNFLPDPWKNDNLKEDYGIVTVLTEDLSGVISDRAKETTHVPVTCDTNTSVTPRPGSVQSQAPFKCNGTDKAPLAVSDHEQNLKIGDKAESSKRPADPGNMRTSVQTLPDHDVLESSVDKPVNKSPVQAKGHLTSPLLGHLDIASSGRKVDIVLYTKGGEKLVSKEVTEYDSSLSDSTISFGLDLQKQHMLEGRGKVDECLSPDISQSNKWNFRDVINMFLPQTVQTLASHTKSYIHSCMHSNKPSERDLLEIHKIFKESLSIEDYHNLLKKSSHGSSVDISHRLDDLGSSESEDEEFPSNATNAEEYKSALSNTVSVEKLASGSDDQGTIFLSSGVKSVPTLGPPLSDIHRTVKSFTEHEETEGSCKGSVSNIPEVPTSETNDENSESDIAILEKHFQTVLQDIISVGASNLRKSSRNFPQSSKHSIVRSGRHDVSGMSSGQSDELFNTSEEAEKEGSFYLHDAMLSRLQMSVPVLGKSQNKQDSGQTSEDGSVEQYASWTHSRESLLSKNSAEVVAVNNPTEEFVHNSCSDDGNPVVVTSTQDQSNQTSASTKLKTSEKLSEVCQEHSSISLQASLAMRRSALETVLDEDEGLNSTSPDESDHCTHASDDVGQSLSSFCPSILLTSSSRVPKPRQELLPHGYWLMSPEGIDAEHNRGSGWCAQPVTESWAKDEEGQYNVDLKKSNERDNSCICLCSASQNSADDRSQSGQSDGFYRQANARKANQDSPGHHCPPCPSSLGSMMPQHQLQLAGQIGSRARKLEAKDGGRFEASKSDSGGCSWSEQKHDHELWNAAAEDDESDSEAKNNTNGRHEELALTSNRGKVKFTRRGVTEQKDKKDEGQLSSEDCLNGWLDKEESPTAGSTHGSGEDEELLTLDSELWPEHKTHLLPELQPCCEFTYSVLEQGSSVWPGLDHDTSHHEIEQTDQSQMDNAGCPMENLTDKCVRHGSEKSVLQGKMTYLSNLTFQKKLAEVWSLKADSEIISVSSSDGKIQDNNFGLEVAGGEMDGSIQEIGHKQLGFMNESDNVSFSSGPGLLRGPSANPDIVISSWHQPHPQWRAELTQGHDHTSGEDDTVSVLPDTMSHGVDTLFCGSVGDPSISGDVTDRGIDIDTGLGDTCQPTLGDDGLSADISSDAETLAKERDHYGRGNNKPVGAKSIHSIDEVVVNKPMRHEQSEVDCSWSEESLTLVQTEQMRKMKNRNVEKKVRFSDDIHICSGAETENQLQELAEIEWYENLYAGDNQDVPETWTETSGFLETDGLREYTSVFTGGCSAGEGREMRFVYQHLVSGNKKGSRESPEISVISLSGEDLEQVNHSAGPPCSPPVALNTQSLQAQKSISLESSEHQRKKQMVKSGCPEGSLLAEDELDSEISSVFSVALGDEPGQMKQTLEVIGRTLHKQHLIIPTDRSEVLECEEVQDLACQIHDNQIICSQSDDSFCSCSEVEVCLAVRCVDSIIEEGDSSSNCWTMLEQKLQNLLKDSKRGLFPDGFSKSNLDWPKSINEMHNHVSSVVDVQKLKSFESVSYETSRYISESELGDIQKGAIPDGECFQGQCVSPHVSTRRENIFRNLTPSSDFECFTPNKVTDVRTSSSITGNTGPSPYVAELCGNNETEMLKEVVVSPDDSVDEAGEAEVCLVLRLVFEADQDNLQLLHRPWGSALDEELLAVITGQGQTTCSEADVSCADSYVGNAEVNQAVPDMVKVLGRPDIRPGSLFEETNKKDHIAPKTGQTEKHRHPNVSGISVTLTNSLANEETTPFTAFHANQKCDGMYGNKPSFLSSAISSTDFGVSRLECAGSSSSAAVCCTATQGIDCDRQVVEEGRALKAVKDTSSSEAEIHIVIRAEHSQTANLPNLPSVSLLEEQLLMVGIGQDLNDNDDDEEGAEDFKSEMFSEMAKFHLGICGGCGLQRSSSISDAIRKRFGSKFYASSEEVNCCNRGRTESGNYRDDEATDDVTDTGVVGDDEDRSTEEPDVLPLLSTEVTRSETVENQFDPEMMDGKNLRGSEVSQGDEIDGTEISVLIKCKDERMELVPKRSFSMLELWLLQTKLDISCHVRDKLPWHCKIQECCPCGYEEGVGFSCDTNWDDEIMVIYCDEGKILKERKHFISPAESSNQNTETELDFNVENEELLQNLSRDVVAESCKMKSWFLLDGKTCSQLCVRGEDKKNEGEPVNLDLQADDQGHTGSGQADSEDRQSCTGVVVRHELEGCDVEADVIVTVRPLAESSIGQPRSSFSLLDTELLNIVLSEWSPAGDSDRAENWLDRKIDKERDRHAGGDGQSNVHLSFRMHEAQMASGESDGENYRGYITVDDENPIPLVGRVNVDHGKKDLRHSQTLLDAELKIIERLSHTEKNFETLVVMGDENEHIIDKKAEISVVLQSMREEVKDHSGSLSLLDQQLENLCQVTFVCTGERETLVDSSVCADQQGNCGPEETEITVLLKPGDHKTWSAQDEYLSRLEAELFALTRC